MSKSIRFWVLSALLVLLHTTGYAEKYDGLYDRPTYFQDFQQSTTWVNNMVCVVCVRTGENGPKASNYEVAVYDKDGVLRCCKRSIAADGDLATLTIVGNDGETFTFKVVYGDIASPTVAAVEETLTFVTNGVVGKTEPMSLTLAGRTEQFASDRMLGTVENPYVLQLSAEDVTGTGDGEIEKVELYDILGRLVAVKAKAELSNMPSGVYMKVVYFTDGSVRTEKVTK
jgi:hypothetical protein